MSTKQNKESKKKKYLIRTYYIVAFLICCIPVAILFTRTGGGQITYENKYIDISNEWSLSIDGDKISCDDIGKYIDDTGSVSMYYRIPSDFSDDCFMYRSKDAYTAVYFGDEIIFETQYYESVLYNKSPGNLWNTVKIKPEYKGNVIRMEVKMVYDKGSVCVDSTRLGDKMNVAIGYAMSKSKELFISIAMIITGFTLCLVNIYSLFHREDTNASSFSLAVFSIVIGGWCLIETNVLQMYVDDGRLLQLVDNICMFVGLLPMLFYLDSFYNILRYRFIRIICWLDVILLAFCFVVQVTDISDVHHYIIFATIFFGILAFIMIVISATELMKRARNKTLETAHMMHIIGFLSLILPGLIPAFKYMRSDVLDRAGTIRIGVFFFILFSVIGNQIQNANKMSKAIKYEFIKNLAYQDGLTGLNNRTSYLEKLKEYEENDVNKLGVVFLDINNLKLINDKFGHDAGDEYIIAAANVIKESFGTYGCAYRIGGDEFCVFIEGVDVQGAYDSAKIRFNELVNIKQENLLKEIELQIAYGFEVYTSGSDNKLRNVIKTADEKMYKKKADMKK